MTQVFLKLFNMSIAASWLVLAVLVLRLALKKAPRWIHVLLWGILAVRLLCPTSLGSVLSLIPSAQTVSPEIMLDATPTVATGIGALDQAVNPVITAAFTPDPWASANPLQIWIPVAANFWFLGVAAMALYTAISYWRLCRKVATAVRLEGNVFQSEFAASPFVLGIVRPRIYLPFSLSEQDREAVLAHERAHIARKDHWWKPLGFLALMLHWFNPLIWLGYILLCQDIELACDEKVIATFSSGEKADYTQALVHCSVRHTRIAACPLAFGEVGVKARVKSVLRYKKPGLWLMILALLLCAVIAVCFLTDPLSPVRNPWTQEYFPGTPGFYGTVDKDAYESIHEDFSIGADRYGRPVFKTPQKAFRTFTVLYAEGIALIREQNGLKPISENNYTSYKKLGWQTTSGPEEAQSQAAFVSKFLDIYENSFTKDAPMPEQETPTAEATAFLAEVLEIWDNCFLVRPLEGSRELSSADKITVPGAGLEHLQDVQIGSILEIHYDGQLMESYPAQIGTVYQILVYQMRSASYTYFITVAEENIYSIRYSTPTSSGECRNTDGAAYRPAEMVYLEGLDGLENLRGVTVEALGKDGNVIWGISVPDSEEHRYTKTVSDGIWSIRPGE